ncbi:MAG: hydroxyacid dehydrogenase [Opitutaceae bacterium]
MSVPSNIESSSETSLDTDESFSDVANDSIRKQKRAKAVFMLGSDAYEMIYPTRIRESLGQLLEIVEPPYFTDSKQLKLSGLEDVEIVLSGWKMRSMDQEFLDAMPKLKAVFYGAGTIRYIVTPEFWRRDILISSAYAVNAVPVAEYTLSTILLSMKRFWKYANMAKVGQGWEDYTRPSPKAWSNKVGLVSCGMVARETIKLLRQFNLDVSVYCPFLTACEADNLGVSRATLKDVFRESDVVSLHTPNLPETKGLIGREHFSIMKQDATFINTARGQVIREEELIEVASERSDLHFILDVTNPEPPSEDSLLLSLPNVVLTPHIAGSMGVETERLGAAVVDEVKRYLDEEPLKWAITEAFCKGMA